MKRNLFIVGLVVFGFAFFGCDNGTTNDNNNTNYSDYTAPAGVQNIYNSLKNVRTNSRSVTGIEGIRTDYLMAYVCKVIGGEAFDLGAITEMTETQWAEINEGDVKLMHHGLNGEGIYIWIFASIQNGERYGLSANNDVAIINATNVLMGTSLYIDWIEKNYGSEGVNQIDEKWHDNMWLFRWQ
jgi:hypothetical protein